MSAILKLIYFAQFLYIFIIHDIKECGAERFIMPDEGERHNATWMAYGATKDAWGESGSDGASRSIARKDLIRIAANLAKFEKVKMLINDYDLNEAEEYLNEMKEVADVNTENIEFIPHPINDLWMRDTGPIFVYDSNKVPHGINFNFNGWGQEDMGSDGWKKSAEKRRNGVLHQRVKEDRKVANFIIKHTGVKKVKTWLVMEGGGVEINGKGTAICTESCILNENRNPGKSRLDVEKELFRILGIEKVIWLPGMKGKDITDGHIDFYARFVSDTNVLCALDKNEGSPDEKITKENYEILKASTNLEGKPLTVIPLVAPDSDTVRKSVQKRNEARFFKEKTFAAGYIGFYVANDCVIMPKFGDEDADKAAFDRISDSFPKRKIIQITIDGIANGGGSIHCATQQQIAM